MKNNVVLLFSLTDEKTPFEQREPDRTVISSVGSRAIDSSQIPQTALHGPSLKENQWYFCELYA